ncbi:hypothetical protein ACQR1I_05260 [Bradyrhizobium sp. HKCCYLS2038]|uniref:hypothetical protein n=1 Tax=unclassified Bradyrhizobium TaxID=2631580 RepID=UPI003EBCE3DC
MAKIIKFPAATVQAVYVEGADLAPESSVALQLVQLRRTLESWRQILRQLDQLAEADGSDGPCEQSRHIRALIADAERAIAEVQDRRDI